MKEHVVPAMNEHVVADIEDLQFMRGLAERAWAEPSAPKTLSSTTRSVTPTRRSRPSKEVYAKQTTVSRADREDLSGGMVPGMQTVFMKTQGCAHNVSDGEYMAGLLASYGYEITEEWSEKVDVFLFNSCTVKGPSQDSFLNMVTKAKQSGAPVVVAGCVPQGEPGRDDFDGVSIIGTQQIHRVVEVVEEAVNGNTVRLLGQGVRPALELPKIRRNALVEIVPISMGCLNRCTYCKTKHARGDLVSYPPQALVARVQTVVREGVREVWLSSEDTGAYGKDINVPLPQLLDEIVDVLPDGVMLRLGMTNPPHILEHMQQVARILNHPRVFKFLHIPVQCGSNKVLEDMKREYTRQSFEELVDFLLASVPGITLATDIICGFPTETEEDFEQTLQLLEKYKFPVVNIAQFYPRPGTAAAKLKKLQGNVVKDRSRRVTSHFQSYTSWDSLVGTEQIVCVIEYGKDEDYIVGHTRSYTQVLLPRDAALLGHQVVARILSAEKWCVKGEVLRVIEQETALAQVSISRLNVLPTPRQLKATSLTMLPEAASVRQTAGGAVEEDYGDSDDPPLFEKAGQDAGRAEESGSVLRTYELRQRRTAQTHTAAAPPANEQQDGEQLWHSRQEAKRDALRWSALLIPSVLFISFLEPLLTCFAAIVVVFVVSHRRTVARTAGAAGAPSAVASKTTEEAVRSMVSNSPRQRSETEKRDFERKEGEEIKAKGATGEGGAGCCASGESEGCCKGSGEIEGCCSKSR